MRSRPGLGTRIRAAAMAGTLVLAGCSGGAGAGHDGGNADPGTGRVPDGMVGQQPEPGEPAAGGTLTFAAYAEPGSLDPTETIAHGSSGGAALAAVYDVLVRYDHDAGEYVPWLAESLESADESRQWTVELPDDVEFSDGTPLDAEAVVGSVEYYLSAGGSDAPLLERTLDSMTATGETTVVFELTGPWPGFPTMLAQGAGMITAPAARDGAEFEPIGAGPFTLENYAPGEELVLAANEDYRLGRPPLDRVRFTWLPGPEAKRDALESGAVDVAYLREPSQVRQQLDSDATGFLTTLSVGNSITINQRDGRPGADRRVRRALALALRPEMVSQRVFEGAAVPSKRLFPETSEWYAEGVEPLGTDVQRARKLVEQAKADGFDGSVELVNGSDPSARAESMAIKAMLEQVGFTVEIFAARSISEQIRKIYATKDFDLASSALSVGDADPYPRLTAGLHSESPINAGGYANPEMDELLGRLQRAGTERESRAVLAEIERLWQADVPILTLSPMRTLIAWNPDVYGAVPTGEGMMLFHDTWLAG
ncbi:ABC transporter substrate-binding protein [Saccharomonospora iraqiensis]|uniref:ABC transporter substrate-binding protein n=1 Tax=Saccharomonospora iraqiensis TaxID=52698 RepID=UPI00022E4639|nr:ABC transporter substrate-binding protein [Saccharomonospora iraqiensis]